MGLFVLRFRNQFLQPQDVLSDMLIGDPQAFVPFLLVGDGSGSAKKRHDDRAQFRIGKLVFAHSSYSTTHIYHGQLRGATRACRFQTRRDLTQKPDVG